MRLNRRNFLKRSAFAGVTIATWANVARTYAANDKVSMAVIGCGGQGGGGVQAAYGQEFVAACDVDPAGRGGIDKIKKKLPDIKVYTDYRKLLDVHKNLDVVWIATPDHTHFPATVRAIENGAAVYCEKPLTHEVWEARKLRELAAAKKAVTQMGNQGHSSESIRLICEFLWAGALGDVAEVHCISNRDFSAPDARPAAKPVPAGLDWDCWLGPAPHRDFHADLHPFDWRGWLDFGTGSLGDMACHTMDGAVWALKLNEVETFEVDPVEGKPNSQGYPQKAVIRYRFPARGKMPPVAVTWYQGGAMPPRPNDLEPTRKMQAEGSYFIGAKCSMMSGSHCGGTRIIPESKMKETPKPQPVLPRSKFDHGGDLINGAKTKELPSSHFGYSSVLTEIVLLGNIACRAGEKITYDLKNGKVLNNPKADAMLRREPRKGWEMGY